MTPQQFQVTAANFSRYVAASKAIFAEWQRLRDVYVYSAHRKDRRLVHLNDVKRHLDAALAAWQKDAGVRQAGYRLIHENADWPMLVQAHEVYELRQKKRDTHVPTLPASPPPTGALLLPILATLVPLMMQAFAAAVLVGIGTGLLGALVHSMRYNSAILTKNQRDIADRNASYAELTKAEEKLQDMLGIPLVNGIVEDLDYRYHRTQLASAKQEHEKFDRYLEAAYGSRRRGGNNGGRDGAGRGNGGNGGSGRTYDHGGGQGGGCCDDVPAMQFDDPASYVDPFEDHFEPSTPFGDTNTNGIPMMPGGHAIDVQGNPWGTTNL